MNTTTIRTVRAHALGRATISLATAFLIGLVWVPFEASAHEGGSHPFAEERTQELKARWHTWTMLNQQNELARDEPLNWIPRLGTHNSYNTLEDHYVDPNQFLGIFQQLDVGVRVLLLDTIELTGTVRLCHGKQEAPGVTCSQGDTSWTEGLRSVANWLNGHPGEVVMIVVEEKVHSTDSSKPYFHLLDEGIEQELGNKVLKPGDLVTVSGEPRPDYDRLRLPSSDPEFGQTRWPTRREMLAQGKQVIIRAGVDDDEFDSQYMFLTPSGPAGPYLFVQNDYRRHAVRQRFEEDPVTGARRCYGIDDSVSPPIKTLLSPSDSCKPKAHTKTCIGPADFATVYGDRTRVGWDFTFEIGNLNDWPGVILANPAFESAWAPAVDLVFCGIAEITVDGLLGPTWVPNLNPRFCNKDSEGLGSDGLWRNEIRECRNERYQAFHETMAWSWRSAEGHPVLDQTPGDFAYWELGQSGSETHPGFQTHNDPNTPLSFLCAVPRPTDVDPIDWRDRAGAIWALTKQTGSFFEGDRICEEEYGPNGMFFRELAEHFVPECQSVNPFCATPADALAVADNLAAGGFADEVVLLRALAANGLEFSVWKNAYQYHNFFTVGYKPGYLEGGAGDPESPTIGTDFWINYRRIDEEWIADGNFFQIEIQGPVTVDESDGPVTFQYTVVERSGAENLQVTAKSCGTGGEHPTNDGSFDPTTGKGTLDCLFKDGPAMPTVSVTVGGSIGSRSVSDTASLEVSVRNVAPQLTNLSATAVDENGTVTLTGTITDPGVLDTFVVSVNWGDPLDPQTTHAIHRSAGATDFSMTYQYLDDDPSGTASDTYTIAVTLRDKDGGEDSDNTQVVVSNVAPNLSNLTITPVNENGTVTLTGTITDPGTLDTFTLDIDWGDPLSPSNAQQTTYGASASPVSFSLTHQYLDDNPTGTPSDNYSVSLTLKDDDGGQDTAVVAAQVANVSPQLVSLSATPIDENGTTTLTGTISDPGTLDTFTVDVDWGDSLSPGNTTQHPYGAGASTFTLTHQYLDDNPTATPQDSYAISLTVTDDDTGSSGSSTSVQVANLVPHGVTIQSLSDETGAVIGQDVPVALLGLVIDLAGHFSDTGTLDTHAAATDWGDGTTTASALTQGSGSGSVADSHAYLQPGTHGLTLMVTDDDTGASQAQSTLRVVDAIGAAEETILLLEELTSSDPVAAAALASALDKIRGDNGGADSNGALDRLQQGTLVAALEKFIQALGLIADASAADPTLDTQFIRGILALTGKSVAVQAIARAESRASSPSDDDKIASARASVAAGDNDLAAGDHVGAVSHYKVSVQTLANLGQV